jgi:molybdopterin synthase catalytic subunit
VPTPPGGVGSARMESSKDSGDWVDCLSGTLPLEEARVWAGGPGWGALVMFTGTVRDWSEGRPGVTTVEYEAYEPEVTKRLHRLCVLARQRWSDLGRIVLLHRTGVLGPSEASVLVVVSAPHRAEAFEAARWSIDQIKAVLPVWKRETWGSGASDWVADACAVCDVPEAI